MTETRGPFEPLPSASTVEQLNLTFNPSSLPLKQRWRNNGLSADFIGDYVTTFYPKDETDSAALRHIREIRASVSYVVNELLENMMKYTASLSPNLISIAVHLFPDRVLLTACNEIDEPHHQRLKQVIDELLEQDPVQLFLQRVEQKTHGEQSAGLGLITMINDYGASIAWKLSPQPLGLTQVITQVRLLI